MDCVLSNTTEEVIKLYNLYTGENLKMKDIVEWDLRKAVPEKHANLIPDLFKNDRLWDSIKPLPDSQYYLSKLSKKYDIYIVTSTPPESLKIKSEWLFKQYPFIKRENLITCNNKQMIGVDLLVDDYEENLINGNYSKILLTYPWNKKVDNKKYGILRVYDWWGIYNGVLTLLPIN